MVAEQTVQHKDVELDWEEWNPAKMSFISHMIAGSAAGIAEHVAMFPFDTIKTHIQCERCGKVSPSQTWACASRIVHNEGVFRLWRGVSAMFAGCIPAHAAYFSVYEASKDFLDSHPMQASISGGLAAVSHDVFMVPFDVIKQRMQLGYYNSMLHCIKTIWKTEGVMGFYASFPTTLMMNVPYGLVMVPVNEAVRNALNPKKTYSFMASMIAGCVAGATAAAITNPLDVIKTRLQTQILETCPLDDTKKIFGSAVIPSSYSAPNTEVINPLKNKNLVSNMIQTIKRIVAEDGYRGFLRGIVPRMIIHTPSVAISWTTYEALKSFLKPVDSE